MVGRVRGTAPPSTKRCFYEQVDVASVGIGYVGRCRRGVCAILDNGKLRHCRSAIGTAIIGDGKRWPGRAVGRTGGKSGTSDSGRSGFEHRHERLGDDGTRRNFLVQHRCGRYRRRLGGILDGRRI